MKSVGLTGSIGAGKSAAVAWLGAHGVAVHDADAAVHQIYGELESMGWLTAHFPAAMAGGQLDRSKMSEIIYQNPDARKKLEAFVHPKVIRHREQFVKDARKHKKPLVVCDIPLLFETSAEKEFDEVWLVTAPDAVRRARVLARYGMTAEKLAHIEAAQMPQSEKIRRATHVIDNGSTLEHLYEQLACLIGQK